LDEKIKEHGKILICGFPGSGKTFLALALAESFTVGPTSAVISPYVYYVNFKRKINLESLKKGIKQRGFLPSVFIFDDCQEKSERLLIDLVDSLPYFLDKKQVFCIFLFRTTLTKKERRDDSAEVRDRFEQDAVIDYTIDDGLFQEIAASLKPGLKDTDSQALLDLTGRDLFILDFILEKVEAADDINVWLKEKGRQALYKKATDTYFKGAVGDLGAILGLLVLAQFDIGIHPGYYKRIYGSILGGAMKEILGGLVVISDSPARYFFLHSSLAELLCRAAVSELQEGGYIDTVTRFSIEYFQHLADAGVDYQESNIFFSNFIIGQLKLVEEEDEENKIKIGFLQNLAVIAAVKKRFDRIVPNQIARMLRLLEGDESFFDYFAVLKEKIESNQYLDTVIFFEFNWVGLLFRFLKEKYMGLFDRLKIKVDEERIKILSEKGNFQGLLNFIKNSFYKDDVDRLDKALGQLKDKDIEQIVERTIKEGRSTGTLPLGLRELKTKGLLEQWESKVIPGNYLRLIAANGTISELMRFIQYSTTSRAGELLDGLSEDYLEDLFANTIDSGCSIGTLHLGLWELQKNGLLKKWESKVNHGHYLRLIAANGTIIELIRILKHSTCTRAGELIDSLSEDYLEDLFASAIDSGRSIGTFNLGLWELQKNGLLKKWESKVSPGHYLRLIAANGTFVELINMLRYSTKTIAGNLMHCIYWEWTAKVIKNTIAKKPSLNPIPWGVQRLLHLCGGDPRLFDEKIGLDNLFHLIITIGSPGILIEVLDILSKSQQQKLIQAFQALPEEKRTGFILQGNFYHFCKAAVHYPQFIVLPGETGPDPGQLASIIRLLIDQSDFFSLNSGIRCIEEIPPSDLKTIIIERLSHSLDLLPREKIESATNSEKVNYLALLNRLEKLDADTLHKIVYTIDRKSYVKEKYFFNSLGYLLYVLASLEVDASLKLEMLELANDDLFTDLLAKQELSSIFYFLWNSYSLFITVKDKRHFNHWLNPGIKEGIFKMINKNKKLGYFTPQYEHLLMLVGLLAYLDIQPSRLRSILSPSYRPNTSRRFLGDKVEKLDFLPGCFFLLGVEFFLGKKVFTHYWKLVLEKKDRYKMQTAALRELMDFAGKFL
jgi:hypothetical protein